MNKDVDRLARVRNNQRNSRARKQEHMKELEQRLASSEEKAQQKDIAHRLEMQKVEADNRNMKALLETLGVPMDFVEQYLQQVATANIAGKIAIPAIQRSNEKSCSKPALELAPASRPAEAEPASADVSMPTQSVKQEIADPAFCGCGPGDDRTSPATDEDVLNSTLCAIAEDMIDQYNTKGVDVEEIRQKIMSGFRAGANGTGCRVQNHVLFAVLDEISSNI
jgi:hypothetical protein